MSVCQEKAMKLLKILLVVVAATGVMGSAQAQTVTDLGTLSSDSQVQTDFFAESSFAEIFNFTVDGSNHTVLASAVGIAPDGTPTVGTVSNLTLELFAGSGATGSALATTTSLDGSLIDLATVLAGGDYSARVSGLADGEVGGGFQFAIAAMPEPAEWMMLLAGLVVVGFMTRRKTSLVTA
jgi:hypothetical protein